MALAVDAICQRCGFSISRMDSTRHTRNFSWTERSQFGCGGGYHTSIVADLARTVTAVDLNTAELARSRNQECTNVEFVEADLATMNLGGGRCGILRRSDSSHRQSDPYI